MEDKNKVAPKEEETLLHNMNEGKNESLFSKITVILIAAGIILGIATGYFLAKKGTIMSGTSKMGQSSSGGQTIYGSSDTSTFKDMAEGVLKEGGIDGEGQYHLVRPGGDSQNVYLTSANVDLSQFINKKIKVWGATQKAQTAGWLMDVGRVQILQ